MCVRTGRRRREHLHLGDSRWRGTRESEAVDVDEVGLGADGDLDAVGDRAAVVRLRGPLYAREVPLADLARGEVRDDDGRRWTVVTDDRAQAERIAADLQAAGLT